MNSSVNPGIVPPPHGKEKEEPELTLEDDIPRDTRTGVEDDWQSPPDSEDR